MAKMFAQAGGDAYCYIFSQPVSSLFSGPGKTAFHGADTGWWLGSDRVARDSALGQAMLQYLLAFARTGDPNSSSTPPTSDATAGGGSTQHGGSHSLPHWQQFHSDSCVGFMELGSAFPTGATSLQDVQAGRLVPLPGHRPFEPIDPAYPGPFWQGLKPATLQLYRLFESLYFRRRTADLMAQTNESYETI